MRKDFYTIDALRGLGAIVVMTWHIPGQPFRSLVPHANLSVDLFIAISGFVMMHSYLTALTTDGFWRFMGRRAQRIYPLYMLGTALGVVAMLGLIVQHHDFAAGLNVARAAVPALLMIPQLGVLAVDDHAYAFNVPGWSLFWEMVACAAFAAFAPRIGRVGAMLLAVGAAIGVVITALAYGTLDVGAYVADFAGGGSRLAFSFVAGALLYPLWRSNRLAWRVPAWVCPLMLLALLAGPGAWLAPPLFDAVAILFALPMLLLLSANTEPSPLLRALFKHVRRLCYPLYIVHVPVIELLDGASKIFLKRPVLAFGIPGAVVTMLVAIGVAVLADRAFDAPLQRRFSQWRRRDRAPCAVPSRP